jgi:cysteine desulfurase
MTTAQRIYLDNAATTPMANEVIEAMVPMMREHYGNPSSTHAHGRKVRGIIEEARGTVAKLLNCALLEKFSSLQGVPKPITSHCVARLPNWASKISSPRPSNTMPFYIP